MLPTRIETGRDSETLQEGNLTNSYATSPILP